MGPMQPNAGNAGPSALLDGPPPHPQAQSPFGAGPNMGGGMGMAPARDLPPDVIMGLLQSGQSVGEMLDTMAQMAPDAAPEFAAAKDILQRGLAKLMTAGGGVAPQSPLTGPLPGATPVSRTGGV